MLPEKKSALAGSCDDYTVYVHSAAARTHASYAQGVPSDAHVASQAPAGSTRTWVPCYDQKTACSRRFNVPFGRDLKTGLPAEPAPSDTGGNQVSATITLTRNPGLGAGAHCHQAPSPAVLWLRETMVSGQGHEVEGPRRKDGSACAESVRLRMRESIVFTSLPGALWYGGSRQTTP